MHLERTVKNTKHRALKFQEINDQNIVSYVHSVMTGHKGNIKLVPSTILKPSLFDENRSLHPRGLSFWLTNHLPTSTIYKCIYLSIHQDSVNREN